MSVGISGQLAALRAGSSLAERLSADDAARFVRYRLAERYYEGRQRLQERQASRSNLVINYCRPVVDKAVSYLLGRGMGFSIRPREEASDLQRAMARKAEQALYDVYWDSDIAVVDLAVATNAIQLGDGVYKVLWDPREKRVRVLSVDPYSWYAEWAADDISTLRQAHLAYELTAAGLKSIGASLGLDPGQAEAATQGGSAAVVETWNAAEFILTVGGRELRRVPNPYGFIPFVHVPNLPQAQSFWGRSDLVDVIPIQDEINNRNADQSDIIHYHADPPVIFRGVNEHTDLAIGPGSVWDIPLDADVKLLEWQGQAVAVQEHIERMNRVLYEISETPRTSFGDSGRLLSGVALEMELRPLIQKTLRRQATFTRAIRRRSAMVLKLLELFGVDHARPGDYAPYRVDVVWPPMVPHDDEAEVRSNIALVGAGLRSHRGAMDRLGEESPEEEIERVLSDRAQLGVPLGGMPGAAADEPAQPVGRPREGRPGEAPAE